VFTQGSL